LKRFRRGWWASAAVLVLACAGLGTASVLQGPRLQGGQIDVDAAVAGPSPLRLVIDEAVADLDEGQVSVSPEVPFTVQTDGSVVLLRFQSALDYDITYRVGLSGVAAAAGGVRADLHYEFDTPPIQATWLSRASSGDRILTGSPGEAPETLFTGARIQDLLPLPGALLVVRLDDAGASYAEIVATDGSDNVERLMLPGGAPVRMALLTLIGTDALYTVTTLDPDAAVAAGLPAFDESLFRLDLTGTHIAEPVLAPDGRPIAADTLLPIPGSTAVLVHSRAGDVYRYDPPSGTAPTLLAGYAEMVALAADGHRLSVKDAFGPLIYDLVDGSESRIEPSPMAGGTAVPFVADVVPVAGGWIERAVLPNADFSAFDSFIARDDGSSTTELFRPSRKGGSVVGYAVTANERYLIAEVSPGGDTFAASDGYEADARPRDVTIVVLDLASGEVAQEWAGSHARW
jgi:hypothetical protein